MKLTEADVTLILRSPSLHTLLRCRRLRYLATLVKSGPAELWAVLKFEQSWLAKLRDDLQWFTRFAPDGWPAVNQQSWPLWHHAISRAPGKFKRHVGLVAKRATIRQLQGDLAAATLTSMRLAASCPGRQTAIQGAAAADEAYYCGPCKKFFVKKANFACHMRQVHERHADHMYYCGGTRCSGCQQEYFSMPRIVRHLQNATTCWQTIRDIGLVAEEPQAGIGSKQWKAEVFSKPNLCPPMRQDRFTIIYDDNGERLSLPRERRRSKCASFVGGAVEEFIDRLEPDTEMTAAHGQLLWDRVREVLCRFPLFVEEHSEALRECARDVDSLHSEAFSWPARTLQWVLKNLQQWAGSLTYAALAASCKEFCAQSGCDDEGPQAGVLSFHKPFPFVAGQHIIFMGDTLEARERTRLSLVLQNKQIMAVPCSWSLERPRQCNWERTHAMCLTIVEVWEAGDTSAVHQGLGSFALEAWSECLEYRRAVLCRVIFAAIRQMWRLALHGRVVAFAVKGSAACLLETSPFVQLRSCGIWRVWSKGDWTFEAGGGQSLSEAWSLHLIRAADDP